MAPKFGTSGLRGLNTELSPALVRDYVAAFLAVCPFGTGLYLGRDLRASSPAIAAMVVKAAQDSGVAVTDCGAVPTPALALAAMQAGASAVMVTGSHIPADRNGLKFYTPQGEITKADEQAILGALGRTPARTHGAAIAVRSDVSDHYIARYVAAFGDSLDGMRIGIYAHSAVGADLLQDLLTRLGAQTTILGRSKTFIPVDTEALPEPLRVQLRNWACDGAYDAIVSTDADGDRPLVADETGHVVPGDILGQITAAAVGADTVVTPISSNTGVAVSGRFGQVITTPIGSPHVIAAMAKVSGRVAGYEANGGFLLGFEAATPCGFLPPLLTRDAVLPIVAVLYCARNTGLLRTVAAEPARFTAADRLQGIPTQKSAAFLDRLIHDSAARHEFLQGLNGQETTVNLVDGLRITLRDGRIIHLRPSGNAPELRFYTEADSPELAGQTLISGIRILRNALN